jgi:hypothetical protein
MKNYLNTKQIRPLFVKVPSLQRIAKEQVENQYDNDTDELLKMYHYKRYINVDE